MVNNYRNIYGNIVISTRLFDGDGDDDDDDDDCDDDYDDNRGGDDDVFFFGIQFLPLLLWPKQPQLTDQHTS